MSLHVVSDSLTAAAYFAIPIAIAVFVHRRKDLSLQHRALAFLFCLFILACGGTHVMSVVVLWRPYYAAEGVLKGVTAVLSLTTALVLPLLIPFLLRIPSPQVLAAEIDAHKATLADLRQVREELAAAVTATRTDLEETTRRFETALRGSPVTVFEQDEAMIYTWVYNAPLSLSSTDMIGQRPEAFFSPGTVADMVELKRRAIQTGCVQRQELYIAGKNGSGWFDVSVEPVTLRDGRPGLIATSADITELKRHQDHLHVVMRELNHRSKNLLSVVMSVTRQTAKSFDIPKEFGERLQERLSSLASAHDVLARQSWRGADMRSIIEGQLSHQLQTFGDRVVVHGERFDLAPEAAHYVGMALHELGSNAVKYGALSGDEGSVDVSWELLGAGETRRLRLTWREDWRGAPAEQGSGGFGSMILKTLTPNALRGQAELSIEGTSVRWTLEARLPDDGATAASTLESLGAAAPAPEPTPAETRS